METSQDRLLDILDQRAIFEIPIYQRKYRWKPKQCERLFRDIMKVGNKPSQFHFFGSIVAIKPKGTLGKSRKFLEIIDGQQRLTTITLLLHALSKIVPTRNVTCTDEPLILGYLFNKEPNRDKSQKLRLTYGDKETLDQLLNTDTLPKDPAKNIQVNYDYFTKELTKLTDEEIDIFWTGVESLQVATISLDLATGDDPQLIFETLNSTGLALTQADLVRNFLLMGIQDKDEQKRLWETYWKPMDKIIDSITLYQAFDNYLKDFLTVKRISIPYTDDIYEEFKEYYSEEKENNEACLKELNSYVKLFEIIANASHPDITIKQALFNVNKLKITVVYPLLLQIFLDFKENKITKNVVKEILETVESYRLRRQVCELGTTGEDKLLAGVYRRIDQENDQTYIESVKAILQSQQGKRRFPKDDEFLDKLRWANMYWKRNTNYPLLKLENSLRLEKEPLLEDAEGIEVEHVLPQNPSPPDCWRKALGDKWQDIQKVNVNRLGNLTITKYNPENSDKCFIDKKRISLDDTNYRLSEYFKDLTIWDEKTIGTRTEELAQKALKVWKYPNLSDEIVNKYADEEDEEDEDEEDVLKAEAKWLDNKKKADPIIIRLLDELTKEIEPKYSPVSTLVYKSSDTRLHFHTEEPQHTENLFLIITVKKEVLKIIFRIDPNNTAFANAYIKNKKLTKRKWADWFRELKSPDHAERRMAIRSSEDLSLALEQIEHAYQTTSKRLNYKNT